MSLAFAALGDPIRRDLVARLATGDATVGELAAPHEVSKQAIAKHLQVLEAAGLVTRPGDAYRRPVRLDAEVLDSMTNWIERYRRQADERFRRLDDLLATMPDDASTPTSPSTPATTPTSPTQSSAEEAET
ncbi:MAG: transcriptional regulator, ArsR family [Ilumatobacteraceae bacterium]|nr:transcriptional regulator, ArsR family [Ilumatobacteraceae bacterium]